MYDVLLLREGFGKLDLVVVEQVGVGDDDDGDGGAEGVKDRARAWR